MRQGFTSIFKTFEEVQDGVKKRWTLFFLY